MFATLVFMLAVNGDPPSKTCTISGKVVLRREGEVVSPMKRVVVYLDDIEDHEKLGGTKTVVQTNRQFEEPVMVLVRHEKIRFRNADKEEHDVFARQYENTFPPDRASRSETTGLHQFRTAGHTRVQCNIHARMRTDVLVLKGYAFHQVMDDEGTFRITDVPPGKHQLVAWEPNGARTAPLEVTCADHPTVTIDEAPRPTLLNASHRPYTGEYADESGHDDPERFRTEKK